MVTKLFISKDMLNSKVCAMLVHNETTINTLPVRIVTDECNIYGTIIIKGITSLDIATKHDSVPMCGKTITKDDSNTSTKCIKSGNEFTYIRYDFDDIVDDISIINRCFDISDFMTINAENRDGENITIEVI